MTTYTVYYLASSNGIEAGPFPTVDAAVLGKNKFVAPYRGLLKVIRSTVEAEEL